MDNSTRLFGQCTKQHWIDIREKLKSNPKKKSNWRKATKLLELRLETRYFDPISKILKVPDSNENSSASEDNSVGALSGEGFAAMTLICSLIEFLQSCYEGKKYKQGIDEKHFRYGKSGK